MDAVIIYITAKDKEQAATLARELLTEKLIACANIFENVMSIYRWMGNIEEAKECVIIAKSRGEHVQKICERVEVLHSYDCPCVVATPVSAGHKPFLEWIEKETTTG